MPLRTLLIDDEPPARERLRLLLTPYHNHISIVGEAADGATAVDLIERERPDLIFLDIQMPLLNGLEVMQQVKHLPMVVFCTAYDSYALEAFNTLSIDYLLKPVSPERIALTVQKIERMEQKVTLTDISALIRQMQPQQERRRIATIPVKHGERITLVSVNEVSYFMSGDKYVSIFTRDSREHVIDQSLRELEENLPEHFLRIHKSTIINTQMVHELQRYLGARFVFILNDAKRSRIVSGRNYGEAIKACFGI